MGHTKPPFTWQYQIEKGYFSKFRRALLLAEDKNVFDLLWNKAEFHITAAEKASHPLPIATILMMMLLEQQKIIEQLDHQSEYQAKDIEKLEEALKNSQRQVAFIKSQLDGMEDQLEVRLQAFREEMLSIKYSDYDFSA